MKPCPCINCLIYPLCKAQIDEYIKNNIDKEFINGSTIYEYVLMPKCILIRHWLNRSPFTMNVIPERYIQIYNLFQINVIS